MTFGLKTFIIYDIGVIFIYVGGFMDIFMPMSTTSHHNKLINTFIGDVLNLIRKKEIYALQSDCALVHWGSKKEPDFISLVNIKEIEDIDRFKSITINELYYVQPDFMLFKNNPYISNERETRTAGCPDLIVEIWSENNLNFEREFKLDLYSSSPITEHWYIEQDSNEVICYFGSDKIETQSLTNVLVTRGGIKFDLRYLAI